MTARRRWWISLGTAALGAALLCICLLSWWADRVLLDEARFSARVASTLHQEQLNRYLAGELTDQVVVRVPELLTVRPAVEAVLGEALRTRTAIVGARAALRAVHRELRSGGSGDAVTLDLQAIYTLASALLERGAPGLAPRFEAGLDASRIDASSIGLASPLFTRFNRIAGLMWPSGIASLALFATSIAMAPRRDRGLLIVACALGASGAIGLLGEQVAQRMLAAGLPGNEDARQAAAFVWQSLLQEYRGWNLGLISVGLSSAVGAIALSPEPDDRYYRRMLTGSRGARILAGVLLATFGVATIRWPLGAVRVVAVAAGVAITAIGVGLLLRQVLATVQARLHLLPSRATLLRYGLGVTLVAITVGLVMASWLASEPPPSPVIESVPITVCNGHEELCGRPLDEVVFAGTHNSMAAATARGWYFPSQRYGIAQQLRDGIRAFLIDTYYGHPSEQGVRTEIADGVVRAQLVAEHGEAAVAAAERIGATLTPSIGERGIYLCHSFCELGSTPLAAALVDLRDFLDEHPGEFVILILQDTTTPADTVAEFELADLAGRAYAHEPGQPWPALGALLDVGTQLLVLAEEEAGAAPWYQLAFDVFQETDWHAASATALDCRPGRGADDNPLMLQNQWVTARPPLPSRAIEVNALDVIVSRAERCAIERGMLPTVVAVDFYDIGDLLAAVDVLNGVAQDDETIRTPALAP